MRESTKEKLVCVIEKQKIGVVGMSRGAGATLLATSLAKVLSAMKDRRVTFLEISDNIDKKKALLYDSIGIDKRFKAREFVRFYGETKAGENIRMKNNHDDGINWGLITPQDVKEETELSPVEIVRLINNISGNLIICDISECKNIEDYLIDMDFVIFVVDPLPSGMIAGFPFMREVKRLEHRGKKVIWIINKFNSGINKRDMLNFLKLKEYYRIPFITVENFYGAEYNCKLPFEMIDILGAIKEPLERIVKNELFLS